MAISTIRRELGSGCNVVKHFGVLCDSCLERCYLNKILPTYLQSQHSNIVKNVFLQGHYAHSALPAVPSLTSHPLSYATILPALWLVMHLSILVIWYGVPQLHLYSVRSVFATILMIFQHRSSDIHRYTKGDLGTV